ncbi:hypothetical protein C8R43DRAFT_949801 [Mycena crocata]|nr:hypothetical protein C8R43DRAFT_949801 [Mycena crocata]
MARFISFLVLSTLLALTSASPQPEYLGCYETTLAAVPPGATTKAKCSVRDADLRPATMDALCSANAALGQLVASRVVPFSVTMLMSMVTINCDPERQREGFNSGDMLRETD